MHQKYKEALYLHLSNMILKCVNKHAAMLQLLQRESRKLQRSEELQKVSAAEKASKDEQRWRAWLARYRERLQLEADAGASPTARVDAMNSVNPR